MDYSFARGAARKGRAPDAPLSAWAAGFGPRVADLLRALARLTTYSNDPVHLPARALAEQLAAARAGVRYLDGGWSSLVTALLGVAEEADVEVALRTPVSRVDVAGGPRVHLRDGRVVAAQRVIATGPLDRVAGWLPDGVVDVMRTPPGRRPSR